MHAQHISAVFFSLSLPLLLRITRYGRYFFFLFFSFASFHFYSFLFYEVNKCVARATPAHRRNITKAKIVWIHCRWERVRQWRARTQWIFIIVWCVNNYRIHKCFRFSFPIFIFSCLTPRHCISPVPRSRSPPLFLSFSLSLPIPPPFSVAEYIEHTLLFCVAIERFLFSFSSVARPGYPPLLLLFFADMFLFHVRCWSWCTADRCWCLYICTILICLCARLYNFNTVQCTVYTRRGSRDRVGVSERDTHQINGKCGPFIRTSQHIDARPSDSIKIYGGSLIVPGHNPQYV